MKTRGARPRAIGAALVVAAHVALLLGWVSGVRVPLRAAETARVSVRLLSPAPAAPAPDIAPRPAAPRAAAMRRALPAARTATLRPVDAPSPSPLVDHAQPVAALAGATASQAKAEALPSLLDGEAMRRAIRASVREPGLAAQAGRIGPALATPDERLGAGVQQGAKGDCLKGEYLGGGMGLLSLPFLAAAALRDRCRR